MIEKLSFIPATHHHGILHLDNNVMNNKINEIIDAVNHNEKEIAILRNPAPPIKLSIEKDRVQAKNTIKFNGQLFVIKDVLYDVKRFLSEDAAGEELDGRHYLSGVKRTLAEKLDRIITKMVLDDASFE